MLGFGALGELALGELQSGEVLSSDLLPGAGVWAGHSVDLFTGRDPLFPEHAAYAWAANDVVFRLQTSSLEPGQYGWSGEDADFSSVRAEFELEAGLLEWAGTPQGLPLAKRPTLRAALHVTNMLDSEITIIENPNIRGVMGTA